MTRRGLGRSLLFVFLAACRGKDRPEPAQETAAATPSATPPPEPIHSVDVAVPGDLTAYAIRGAREHRLPMIFLGGMCVHPLGYIQAFAQPAAARGDLLGLQGDVLCGGGLRRWSYDLAMLDRRIDAAFAAAGLGTPRDVLVIGYSQGAERAEQLIAHWPEKYSRAILIASPVTPAPATLKRAKAVALMAGDHDISQERMRGAVRPLEQARVPAIYFRIAHASHGQLGDDPEAVMRQALDFVDNDAPPK